MQMKDSLCSCNGSGFFAVPFGYLWLVLLTSMKRAVYEPSSPGSLRDRCGILYFLGWVCRGHRYRRASGLDAVYANRVFIMQMRRFRCSGQRNWRRQLDYSIPTCWLASQSPVTCSHVNHHRSMFMQITCKWPEVNLTNWSRNYSTNKKNQCVDWQRLAWSNWFSNFNRISSDCFVERVVHLCKLARGVPLIACKWGDLGRITWSNPSPRFDSFSNGRGAAQIAATAPNYANEHVWLFILHSTIVLGNHCDVTDRWRHTPPVIGSDVIRATWHGLYWSACDLCPSSHVTSSCDLLSLWWREGGGDLPDGNINRVNGRVVYSNRAA